MRFWINYLGENMEISLKIIKEKLFITTDRKFTTIASICSILSFGVMLYTMKYPETIPQVIIIRDIFIVIFLVNIALYAIYKYISNDYI